MNFEKDFSVFKAVMFQCYRNWSNADLCRVVDGLSIPLTVWRRAAVTMTYQTHDEPIAWPDGLPVRTSVNPFERWVTEYQHQKWTVE